MSRRNSESGRIKQEVARGHSHSELRNPRETSEKQALALIYYSSDPHLPSPQEQLEKCFDSAQGNGFTLARTLIDFTDTESGLSSTILTLVSDGTALLDRTNFELTYSPGIFSPYYEDFEYMWREMITQGNEVALFNGYQPDRGRIIPENLLTYEGYLVGEDLSPLGVGRIMDAMSELGHA